MVTLRLLRKEKKSNWNQYITAIDNLVKLHENVVKDDPLDISSSYPSGFLDQKPAKFIDAPVNSTWGGQRLQGKKLVTLNEQLSQWKDYANKAISSISNAPKGRNTKLARVFVQNLVFDFGRMSSASGVKEGLDWIEKFVDEYLPVSSLIFFIDTLFEHTEGARSVGNWKSEGLKILNNEIGAITSRSDIHQNSNPQKK